MAAANLDIVIEQGATFRRTFIISSNNTPIDLTGESFRGKIRETASSSASLADFVLTLKDQLTNPGEVEWVLSATNTASIPAVTSESATRAISTYCYDIERVYANGDVDRVFQGLVKFSPEVTK